MGQFTRAWFLSHMRAVKAQMRLCIHTVSPEPSLLSLKRNITQASGQLNRHVLDIKVLIFSLKKLYRWRLRPSIMSLIMSACTYHIRSCKGSGEPALSKIRDIDESSGQKLYLKRFFKEWCYAYAISNKNTFAVPIREESLFSQCIWCTVWFGSPLCTLVLFLCRFPWAKVHMIIPRLRILGLISHRKSASKS